MATASWRCGFKSSLRDALERFTETTTARPCCRRLGMYPSDVLHLILACFYPCSCFCDLFCTCCSRIPVVFPCLRSPQTVRRGIRFWVSGESHGDATSPPPPAMLGHLECQTIPIGLWPNPPMPWTWLLGLGMRVEAVNTQLSQPFRGCLKKDAAKLLGQISPWHGCPPRPRYLRPQLGCDLGKGGSHVRQ